MKVLLGHIAAIQTGLFAKPMVEGDLVYLQAKHFDENGLLQAALHPDLKIANLSGKHLLKDGDVLFAAKGTKNFAAVYENHNQPCVASTTFFVIRLNDRSVTPHFLAWSLNHPNTQKILKANAIGSSIVSISKAVLEELEISIPDLKTQKNILDIVKLRTTEKTLNQQIEALREKQIKQKLLNLLK